MEILKWIQNWRQSHCDGDWEHENSFIIKSVSNPGWFIEIDLEETELEGYEFDMDTVEVTDDDWYFYRVVKNKYSASGDLSKLEFLLSKFRELVEEVQKEPKT